ncbi:MAG: hypothetical protein IKS92_06520 [Victivallales bacterium]|nr:hypothetical protein [Victivallales bacterium]
MNKWLLALMISCWAMVAVGGWEFSPPITDSDPHVVELTITPKNIAMVGDSVDWLRLKDNKGEIVPYHVAEKTEAVFSDERMVVPSNVTQVQSLDGGELEILCEIAEKTPVPEDIHVRFITSQRDFEQQVKVFGEKAGEWTPLLDNGFIFDSNLNVRNLDVTFATAGCRRFRLLLSHATIEQRNALKNVSTMELTDGETERAESTAAVEQSFKMERIELWTVKCVESGRQTKLAKGFMYSMVRDDTHSDWETIHLKPDVYPINGVVIETEDPNLNFSREVLIANMLNEKEEQFLCEAVVHRIKVNGFFKENTTVLFPPVTQGSVILRIYHGDNPWLSIKEFTPLNPEYSLQFVARTDKMPYHLTAEVDGKKPKYDVSDILSLADGKVQPLQMSLDNSMFKSEGFDRAEYRRKKPLEKPTRRGMIIAALVVVVMAMGFALSNVLKQEN